MRKYLGTLALLAIVVVTVAWWALALWPTSVVTPQWLLRTRQVCFGDRGDGLPNATGWLVLIGQPASMLGFLFLVWGADVMRSLRAVWSLRAGRVMGVASIGVLAVALGAAVIRVIGPAPLDAALISSAAPVRLADVPALALTDQHGARVALQDLRGRPVIVAFAYAHCETVCPLIVHDVIRALADAQERAPRALIVTVDPWRDTPARLPAIAQTWQLPASAHVLSGSVAEVSNALTEWNVGSARDPSTGEVTHGTQVYVVAPNGRTAFVLPARAADIVALLRTL